MDKSRRNFLVLGSRIAGAVVLSGFVWRIFGSSGKDSEFEQPSRRYTWQINPDKCRFCGKCAYACVRRPAAVKALNDQKKCSNCVVCYAHITDRQISSARVQQYGTRVCPHNAVRRQNFSGGLDGVFTYTIDQSRCVGCAKCVAECNHSGSSSMFLAIRPDLCLGCNQCACAEKCPYDAIERVPLSSIDDLRDDPMPETSNKS